MALGKGITSIHAEDFKGNRARPDIGLAFESS